MDPVVAEISKETEVPIPASPKRSRKFSALIISGFVLIVVASFFGGTYYQAMSQKKIAMTVSPSPAVEAPTPTTDPSANWKMYSGDTFIFKYPQDWAIDTAVESNILQPMSTMGAAIPGESVRVINPNTETMTGNGTQMKQPSEFVSVLPFTYPGKTVKDIVDLFEKQETALSNPVASQFKRQSVTIGSASGEAFYLGGEGYDGWYTILSDGKHMIGINSSIESPSGATITNQILKTFQFTQSDQVTTDTSQWKTYVFPKAGITFKYPPIYLLGNEFAKGTGQEVSFGVSEKEIQGLKQCFIPGQKPECQSYSLDVNVATASKADYPTVEAFMNVATPANPSEFHVVRVGGFEASRLDQGSEQSGVMTATVFVTLKDSYVEIGLSSNFNPQDNQRYFDQILQSFTFAN